MDMVRHVYTQSGPQKLIPMGQGIGAGKGRFALTLQPGDMGRIETSCDPIMANARQMQWEVFAGGLAGAAPEITALRVVLGPLSGWAELVVESNKQEEI